MLLIFLALHSVYSSSYIPGKHYFATNNTIEYIAGNLPIILSAPHGGQMTPDFIPDRTSGTFTLDTHTDLLTLAIYDELLNLTKKHAHVIITHVSRKKVDCNRDEIEGAQGNPNALEAWYSFHNFIEDAKNEVSAHYGKGFYVDVHGHGHSKLRVELGWALSESDIDVEDSVLETKKNKSTIRNLAHTSISGESFVNLIRGNQGFGGLLENEGIQSVPSPTNPRINGDPYFTGGYNCRRHGSREAGNIDGVQMETHKVGLRDTEENRKKTGRAVAKALIYFFKLHYGLDLEAVDPVSSLSPAESSFGGGFNSPVSSNGSNQIVISSLIMCALFVVLIV